MPEFVTGEYLNVMEQRLLRELKNDKDDFMSVIPNAPAEAIMAEGVRLNLLLNELEAEIDRADAYDANDIVGFNVEKGFIPWHTITTPPFSLSKDQMRASAILNESEKRAQIKGAIQRKYRDYTLHSIAPEDDTDVKFPVLRSTGEDDGTGRLRLTLTDLINYSKMWRALNLPAGYKVYGVLCTDHLTDLQLDTKAAQNFRDLYHNRQSGEPVPLYNFNWFWNNSTVSFASDGTKKAIGAAAAAGDQSASVFFWAPATMKGIGKVTVQHDPQEQDVYNVPPVGLTNAHGYVFAERVRKEGTGAIVSGNAA